MSFGTQKPGRGTCKVCKQRFIKSRAIQPVCDEFACKVAYGIKMAEKSAEKRNKKERAELRTRKEKIKTRSDYIKEAQIAFNAYIRCRDIDKPCICCDKPLITNAVGGGFDCGHYRSVGSAPQLRFDERNAHGQSKQCNRYGAGRAVDYRIGLINRYGIELVESLEADQTTKKWTIEELKEIKKLYQLKLKELKSKEE